MAVKYDNCYYWENLLINGAPIWRNSFQNLSLTKESIFVNTIIINYDKEILENNWAYYPNVKALLGFVQYIYLSTAFYTLLNNASKELVIPLAPSEKILEYISDFNKEDNNYNISAMKKDIDKLNSLWHMEDKEYLKALKHFTTKFNKKWSEKDRKMLHYDAK